MTIGIIGSGAIGTAFARTLARAGIAATISNSRGPDSLKALVRELGPSIKAGTREEAARADIVFIAVNWTKLPAALAGLIALIEKGTISSSIAKDVFAKMYDTGRLADDIVAAEGLAQNSDEGALLAIVRDVIARNADAAAQFRAGKSQTFGFLVGQVMKGSGGKANPKLANELLRRELQQT